MTENIMQCCYTNAVQEVGGKISSGWQPVAVSDNIPSEAYNGCVSLQNANATIQAPMVDERGNVLNLYEITGDGSFVYVSRTQYGLVDRLGRPNMFSHAYIFSWKKEDVIGDPNTFLTIDRSNFAEDEQTASTQKTQLHRNAALTLEQAMRTAGLTPETYLTLIQCVYCQFSERKAAKPLFIQFDGSEEQMQAILYCIYFGLPHYVRKSLSIASAISNTSDSKNIIFSEFASKHETYIIPQTGENNLLTQRAERKIARLGFSDFAVRNCTSIDARQYFAQLDKLAMELGDPTASNELVLKIAHQLIEKVKLSDLGDEELDNRLSDALHSKTYGSQRMDEYISDMLDEVRARKARQISPTVWRFLQLLVWQIPGSSIISIASAHFLWKRRPKCLPTCPKTSLRDIAKPWRKTTRGSRFWIATMQSTHCLAKRSHGRRFPHCWMKPVL